MEKKKRNINPTNPPGPKGKKVNAVNFLCNNDFYYKLQYTSERLEISKAEVLRRCFMAYYLTQRDFQDKRIKEIGVFAEQYARGQITKDEYEKQCKIIEKKDY